MTRLIALVNSLFNEVVFNEIFSFAFFVALYTDKTINQVLKEI